MTKKKKQKIPKYIINKFKKPQFKVGDIVLYSFLGDSGYGKIISVKNEKVDHNVSYTVEGNGYKYPCGLKIKEHKSYQFGYILYDETTNHIGPLTIPRRKTNTTTDDSNSSKRTPRDDSKLLSIDGKPEFGTEDVDRDIITDNSIPNDKGRKDDRESSELESAIDKQKAFLRGFTKK